MGRQVVIIIKHRSSIVVHYTAAIIIEAQGGSDIHGVEIRQLLLEPYENVVYGMSAA